MGSERKDGPERKFPTDEGSLRIHQAIARQLGTAILTGVHKPGDLFEGEIEASVRLHVSRTAYREAVRILIAKGMLESRPKAGTRVLPRSRWNVSSTLATAKISETWSCTRALSGRSAVPTV